jgi:hypothetical protein
MTDARYLAALTNSAAFDLLGAAANVYTNGALKTVQADGNSWVNVTSNSAWLNVTNPRYAVVFNGTNNYIDMGAASLVYTPSGDNPRVYSIMMSPNSLTGTPQSGGFDGTWTSDYVFIGITYGVWKGGYSASFPSGGSPATGTWYFASINPSNFTVNGTVIGATSGTIYHDNNSTYVGAMSQAGPPGNYCNWTISEAELVITNVVKWHGVAQADGSFFDTVSKTNFPLLGSTTNVINISSVVLPATSWAAPAQSVTTNQLLTTIGNGSALTGITAAQVGAASASTVNAIGATQITITAVVATNTAILAAWATNMPPGAACWVPTNVPVANGTGTINLAQGPLWICTMTTNTTFVLTGGFSGGRTRGNMALNTGGYNVTWTNGFANLPGFTAPTLSSANQNIVWWSGMWGSNMNMTAVSTP